MKKNNEKKCKSLNQFRRELRKNSDPDSIAYAEDYLKTYGYYISDDLSYDLTEKEQRKFGKEYRTNDLWRHKTGDRIKWIAVTLAVLLLAAAVMAAMTKGYQDWNPYGWFDKKEEQTDPERGLPDIGNGGVLIGDSIEKGVSLKVVKIERADFAAMGVSERAESALSLTATVLPEDATDKTVNWAVVWSNPDSGFATLNEIENHMTVTPTSDGALTATVECLKAFGEPIKITVTSRDDGTKSAACTADYVKRIEVEGVRFYTGIDTNYLEFSDSSVNSTTPLNLEEEHHLKTGYSTVYQYSKGDGTIEEELTKTVTFKLPGDIVTKAAAAGLTLNAEAVALENFYMDRATFEIFFPGVCTDAAKMKTLVDVINSSSMFGSMYFDVKVSLTGAINNQSKDFQMGLSSFSLRTAVSSVTLDNTKIVF